MSSIHSIFERKSFYSKDVDNTVETFNFIVNNVLQYTKTLEETTPSIFDQVLKIKNSDSELSSLSSESNNSENTSMESNDSICFKDYEIIDIIEILQEKLDLDNNLLILSLMNLDKLLSKNFILTENNVRKVILICIIETQKYYEDINLTNKDYAKIGGITSDELLSLEIEFLNIIDFNLYINEKEFNEYKEKLNDVWYNNIAKKNNNFFKLITFN